jgi:hypothetical protein
VGDDGKVQAPGDRLPARVVDNLPGDHRQFALHVLDGCGGNGVHVLVELIQFIRDADKGMF